MPLPNLPMLAPPPGAAPAALSATGAGPAAAVAGGSAGPAPVSLDPSVLAPQRASFPVELARARERIGLDDAQLAQIDAAEAKAKAGDESGALVDLIVLNQQLDGATTTYLVQPGEGLRQIAVKPEVYGNANLWPLIRDANPQRLADPKHVQAGWKLRIRLHPTASEVGDAIAEARALPP